MTFPLDSGSPPQQTGSKRDRRREILLVAGALQIAAVFTPAVRVKIAGTTPFVRLPNAGTILLALGVITLVIALLRRGWWQWIPGLLSGLILAVAYSKIVSAPSGTFIDPLLRHGVHPAWGFVPMSMSVLIGLIGAAWPRPKPVAWPPAVE